MQPEVVLIALNLVLGFGCAVPLARLLGKMGRGERSALRWFALVVGLYFVEGVALIMGMGIPVLNVGLAFIWALVLRRRLAPGLPGRQALKTALWLSLYSSLPAASFLVIPVLVGIGGRPVLSAEVGAAFGIPASFPWPVSTILGFYAACALGALAAKSLLTVGGFSILGRLRNGSAPEAC
jgi:hypothetical protein